MAISKLVFIHQTAEVSANTKIGANTRIWHHSQVRERSVIGKNCVIGKGVYIDSNSVIGSKVKIQNYASLYSDIIVEDGVFIGPYVCFTNDKLPRAVDINFKLKKDTDWEKGKTIVRKGASIGTGTIVLPDIEIGEFALVGAASLITKNIPKHALVFGMPAKIEGYVCKCGNILIKTKKIIKKSMKCKKCGTLNKLS